MSSLAEKKCIPCEGGVAPLTGEELQTYLGQVSGWELVEDKKIRKQFSFKNFAEALGFINQVGELAETEGHHPDVLLHDYKHATITLSTHAIGGLSENDFILAAKINGLQVAN